MEIIDWTTRLPNQGSNGRRSLASLKHTVVHHAGFLSTSKDNFSRLSSIAGNHIRKGWKRIGYHYAIMRNGAVIQTNPLEELTWHAGNYPINVTGLGIMLDGDLKKQRTTPAQVKGLWELLDTLTTKRPDMPLLIRKHVTTHRKVRRWFTTCPSNTIVKQIDSYKTVL